MAFEKGGCILLPAEIVMRILGRAIAEVGDEGPVELGKLEALFEALKAAQKAGTRGYRRSLAGAIVTLGDAEITVERAPPRRLPSRTKGTSLTKGRVRRAKPAESR
jgi:tRNA(Ile)-lysidine synthase